MQSRVPTIVHLDADAFFVSVEQALDPTLRGKLVAVGGRERGIIASASYEARARGVYTPMPTKQALRVCPELVIVSNGFGRYGEFSRRMFDLCETLTPIVQRNSIDEGYIDLGPCRLRTIEAIVERVRGLQRRIQEEIGITASFGIAANKLVSAVASKAMKPRGFTVVPVGSEAEFLAPLPIGVLPGIGPKLQARLKEIGVVRVRDVLDRGGAEMEAVFGGFWPEVAAMARGEDDREVHAEPDDAKSYSQQETFGSDIGDFAEIERIVKRMIDELLPKIRADGKRARTLTVKVRYPGMEDVSSGRSLPNASDLEHDFYPLVVPLLRQAWRQRRPLRLVSARFSGVEDPAAQLELFGEADARKRRLASVIDRLNESGRNPVVQHGHQIDRGRRRRAGESRKAEC